MGFFFFGNKIGPLSPMFSLLFFFFLKKNYDTRPKKKRSLMARAKRM